MTTRESYYRTMPRPILKAMRKRWKPAPAPRPGFYAAMAGQAKVYIIGYTHGNGALTYTEADTITEAKHIKGRMKADGHAVFIDVYPRERSE